MHRRLAVVQFFPQVAEKLKLFKRMFNADKLSLQKTMAKMLPSIRGGGEDERALDTVIQERSSSPFNSKTLSMWMEGKEREINVLRSFMDKMGETEAKTVRTRAELDREVLKEDVKHALCFAFTSLDSADPYLQTLSDYLASLRSGGAEGGPPQWKEVDLKQWYHSPEVVNKMREKAQLFRDISKDLKDKEGIRFLIAAIENQDHKGASIYHFKDGFPISDDFSRPKISDVESLTTNSDLLWCKLIYLKV